MSINFKSVGHAFATFFKAVVADIPKVDAGISKVEGTKTEVTATTSAILSAVDPAAASTAVGIEDAAYAVLGEVVSVLNAGGAAAEAKLANAGLDQAVITAAKNVAAGASQVGTLVAAATK
jgi:hypothetical protein